LNVPQHIQPGLVDGFVKPGAMGAVEALYVIRARRLATAQEAFQSWGAVRFRDQLVGRASHLLTQGARIVPGPKSNESGALNGSVVNSMRHMPQTTPGTYLSWGIFA
jgi:hypothetical protein